MGICFGRELLCSCIEVPGNSATSTDPAVKVEDERRADQSASQGDLFRGLEDLRVNLLKVADLAFRTVRCFCAALLASSDPFLVGERESFADLKPDQKGWLGVPLVGVYDTVTPRGNAIFGQQ